ncbi:hypothetical protein M3223_02880 [Paenibacillus pasadenensis]|uniref:hypothetical protein n=1 Tax=Paenibacillus pasadenensis TaxID=217090 RepID=UPI0020418492|nr:hypothetical protein [Paenibacillus pasadenensis]MCM3746291.1 hypothetical protein [Paenibacillus pasadenensis]
MKRYAFSIGLVTCTAVIMAAFVIAAFADRVPPYELVTKKGSAEVLKGFALEAGIVRISNDGQAEWQDKGALFNQYSDLVANNDHYLERNELIVQHRSFIRGHLYSDSFYKDNKNVISASVNSKPFVIQIRILEQTNGNVREIEIPYETEDSTVTGPNGPGVRVEDVQSAAGNLHFLVSEIHTPYSGNKGRKAIYYDYIVDYNSGKLIERIEVYRSPEQVEPYTETSVSLISEESEFKASSLVMFHIKTIYRQDQKDSEEGLAQTENSVAKLKERRIMGYDYATGSTWELPRQGIELIGTGLEPKLHGGKLYAYYAENPQAAVYFIDPLSGKQTANRLVLEPTEYRGSRNIMLADGLIYVSWRDRRVPKVAVYDAATQAILYRGEIEGTDSRADLDRLWKLIFTNNGK